MAGPSPSTSYQSLNPSLTTPLAKAILRGSQSCRSTTLSALTIVGQQITNLTMTTQQPDPASTAIPRCSSTLSLGKASRAEGCPDRSQRQQLSAASTLGMINTYFGAGSPSGA